MGIPFRFFAVTRSGLFFTLYGYRNRDKTYQNYWHGRELRELINEIYSLSSSSQLIFEIVLILINDQAPATQFSKAVFTGIFYTHRSCNCCLGLWEQLVPSVGLVSGIGNEVGDVRAIWIFRPLASDHLGVAGSAVLWPPAGSVAGKAERLEFCTDQPPWLGVELWSRNINTRQQAVSLQPLTSQIESGRETKEIHI